MAIAVQKITLSPSRDIPFNKLVLSQSNVRRVKAGVSVEELADDIARRGLLQGLSVRPVVDQAGVETGMFEIPAGGRRYRALELLVKQKRLAKTAPVPYIIRRMLTEGAVRASDKRAQFVGIDAYVEAGGTVLRDLFQGDDGGWLRDVPLVDQMVADKLKAESEAVAAEGWKWIEVAPDFAYGHAFGLRQLRGETIALTAEEEVTRDALQAEFDRLSDEYQDADELPAEVDERLSELETALEGFEARPVVFDPAEVARAGAFVSIASDGCLRVERGYVRSEDELPAEPEADPATGDDAVRAVAASYDGGDVAVADEPITEAEEDEGLSPISDRLMTELTSHRTLGLRQALGERPDVAFLAALHALTLKVFYHYGSDSCLELDLKSVSFNAQAPGLAGIILLLIAMDEAVARADLEILSTILSALLELGLTTQDYLTTIADLEAVQDRVTSYANLAWSLDVCEALAISPSPSSEASEARLRFFLKVVGQSRGFAHRLSPHDFLPIEYLAHDYGVDPSAIADLRPVVKTADDSDASAVLTGKTIGIYTLTEAAGARAKAALKELFPTCTVEVNSDTVCTSSLTNLARTADIFVFAWRSSSHQAFFCVKEALGGRDPVYAAGKGTASLVNAVRAAVAR